MTERTTGGPTCVATPNRRSRRPQLAPTLAAACILLACSAGRTDEPPVDLSQFYGFLPLEIFKLEDRSETMLSVDANGDGRLDLILADNSHSRIDVLQQRNSPDHSDASAAAGEDTVNSVEDTWRFEHRKIPVERQIGGLAAGDFNGDGRLDVAYFGLPDRLTIHFQTQAGDWSRSETLRLPDVAPAPWNMTAGDLNGDNLADLVLLGQNETFLIFGQAEGKPEFPEKIMNTSANLGYVQIADLNGDGRNDLCYEGRDGDEHAFAVRLQAADGRLGPELQFDLDEPRAITIADVDGKPGHEVLTIDSRTGNVRVLRLQEPQSEAGELAGRLVQYGFGKQGARENRDLATGDVDGDGLTDDVVTDPEAARVIVFRQHAGRGLDLGSAYPGLVQAQHVRVGDVDGDSTAEIVVLSPAEKAIGVSRFHDGRLTFPEALATDAEPLVLELADLQKDGQPEIVYISREGGNRSPKYKLQALSRDGNAWKSLALGDKPQIELELGAPPSRLVSFDTNRDGRPDFLIFPEFDRGAPTLLVTAESGKPIPVKSEAGIRLGETSPGAVFIGRENQPPLLVAQRQFARSLQLQDDGQWRVIDQYNAVESSARIVGVASLDLDDQPGDEIVLVDTGVRRLRVLKRDAETNVFRGWREVEIGAFPFQSLHVADLNGDQRSDLLLFGAGRFAVLYADRTDPELKELATFETKLEKVYFTDVVAGDLNGDGLTDLAVIDTRSHYVEILHFDGTSKLQHALHFKIFEEKSFASEDGPSGNPREALISDVTGDGLSDLILLAHDRVLLYPQDDGHTGGSETAANR